MRFSAVQLFSLLASTVLGASDVVDLTASDFDSHVKAHNLVLAEFFAPWCGHCKNLAPEYEQAATDLKNRTEDISLVKVDCTENQDLCTEHGVRGFPTLYVFEDGKNAGQYQGNRKADDIRKFMIKRSLPAVADVKNAQGASEWLASNIEENPVVFLYLGPAKSYDAFAEVAKQKRENAAFISVSDQKLKDKYKSELVVFLNDVSEPAAALPSGAALNEDAIAEFVRSNQFAPFTELGPENYAAYIQNGSPLFYAFAASDDERELLRKSIKPHLELLNGKANVVFLDAAKFGAHADAVGLAEKFPAISVHDISTNKKYIHSQDTDITEKSVAEFVKKFVAGDLEAHVKSEPVPETQDEPVYVLVGNEYDSVVLDNEKDVLVEYYAPWCGHCKNLKPTYEELGEYFQDNDNVVIAKLDHTANEVPDHITGYPTIKLYPAGQKGEPIPFESERSLEKLVEFVEKNGKAKKSTAKAPKGKAQDKASQDKASKDKRVKDEL